MVYKYYSSADLVDRLCNASDRKDKSITFLVGSALTLPDHVGGHGVPGVSGMIDLIRREFDDSGSQSDFENALRENPTDQYPKAFEFLHGRRGQDAANRIVKTAVWQALDAGQWPSNLPPVSPDDADPATCRALEKNIRAWRLPRAVNIFGNLLVTFSDAFGGQVLTTNFDPLIEISVSANGGRFYRTVLHDDGRLGQTVAEGVHVVHLHGYWQGHDTLHTPQQLIQPRPQLRKSLARVVETSSLVVIGYGGRDDIITQTLMDLLPDSESNPEIMWAFHENDVMSLESSNTKLLSLLEPGMDRGRVSLYRDIDCYTTFFDIYEQLKPDYSKREDPFEEPNMIATIREDSGRAPGRRQVRIEMNFALPQQTSAEPDRPLLVDPWVGRDQELHILTSANTPVAFVTGLGGQGKSALAGRFLQEQAMVEGWRFQFWDWRDCREESDRLNTQILRLVERLSDGAIDASHIEVTDTRALIEVLLQLLGNRKALLVFDNVDQYIDLETLEPVKGLDVLIAGAQSREHQSLFLFTCRPDVRIEESRALRVPLTGLTKEETRNLITVRPALKEDDHLASELYRTTEGHPLWVNLILMQAIRHERGLRGALDLIKQGGATLPDTTRTIWGMLNDQQRKVLRTMAELDRSEPTYRLLDLLPGINANRVNRALKTLQSFHLIETRIQPAGEPLLGLHPIIRQFVRTSFPKKDREQYVGAILDFLDRMIGRFQNLLPQNPSYDILEHWIRKAELQITFGRFEEATSIISEIGSALVNRGYIEEIIRITRRLFSEFDWAEACSSYKDFDKVFEACLTQMIQMGHDDTDDSLSKYEAAIPGKSAQFVLLCDLRCYSEWYEGRYESAIRWGEEGDRLKEYTAVDTSFSTTHHLALARRDGGYLQDALVTFLEGESLNAVVAAGEKIPEKEAPFYGNIGRCLYLEDRFDEALVCYIKSAQLLEEGDKTNSDHVNRGYIRYWIAELLLKTGEYHLAAASYRAAVCIWDKTSPPRAAQATEKLQALATVHLELRTYLDQEDWKAEEAYGRWLDGQ